GQCKYGTCYACGWGQKKYPVNTEKLKNRVKHVDLEDIEKVKVYESGSFLDDNQFPKEFREWMVNHLKKENVKKIVVESLPNFITDEKIKEFEGLELTIAIGLEAADDEVLEKYGKPFKVKDYLKAVKKIHEHGQKVKTYLMVNIPFSKENTLEKSVRYTLKHSDKVVLINTYPHNQSKLFQDWIEGKWKPLNSEEFTKKVEKWKSHSKVSIEFENYYFIPKFTEKHKKRKELKGCSEELITHPHYEVWQDYFQRFYKKPKEKETLLLLPCSYRKPYYKSQTHKSIYKTLKEIGKQDKIHRVVLSSPGIIPIDKCDNYPFTDYDWPEWEETPEVKQKYIEANKERVKKYIQNHEYKKILAYFKPSSESWKAIEKAAQELNIDIKNLFDEEIYEEIKDKKNPVANKKALEVFKEKLEKEI
ncbi:MAG: DUF5591 domain-containing protein, partial [archaeon]